MLVRSVRHLAAICCLLAPAALGAQDPGRITGRVISADGSPLGGARVTVVGTTQQATTAVDGRYTIAGVATGNVSIRAIMIGYTPKTVTGVIVTPNAAVTQDITLTGAAAQLDELVVTAKVEQGTVNAALDEQRNSVGIVNAISAEQMARSPDGDASVAMQRMSGATIEDGRTVNMRGLGDRYTTAAADGARIPSPEPERRTVPLDMFPTAVIEAISTTKTFTPDQPGDFSGGAVNIKTKDFTGRRFVSFSLSSGVNPSVASHALGFAPSTGRDWLAAGSSARALPALVGQTDFTRSLTGAETNALVNSFRNKWSVQPSSGAANAGFGATIGGSLPGPGQGIGFLVSGSYSYGQELRSHEVRAQAQAASQVGGEPTAVNRFDGSTARASVLWGGIANLSMALGSTGKLALHNMYNRTMDNEGRSESGISEMLTFPLEIKRLRYVERSIRSSQLSLHQGLNDRQYIEASVTASGVSRVEPDRSEIVYENSTGVPSWLGFSNQAAVRTFGNLHEHAVQADATWKVRFGSTPSARFLQVGAQYRSTARDAVNQAYSITLLRPLTDADRALAPEQLFDGRFTQNGASPTFSLAPLLAGGSYTASDHLAAGFAMLTFELGRKLELSGGARVEHSEVRVSSLSSAFEPSLAAPRYTDLMPSVAMQYRLTSDINLRLSASQTLSRPEYREMSPITYREVIGGDNVRGNAALKRALIRNFDLRWEWYPTHAEVLSFAAFVKDFSDPVERIYQGTSDQHVVTFVNAKGAHNVGIELEGRKEFHGVLSGITGFANLTLMRSRITLDPASGSLTNANRRMVGQAPYVLNAGATWRHPRSDASATILFNRVGERITDAGEIPLPDVIEQPRNVLDASLLLPLFGTFSARFDAKNLLDAAYQRTQGPVIRESYRAGRVFSVGFTWSQ